jgi:Tfp pilus assembly protein PilF
MIFAGKRPMRASLILMAASLLSGLGCFHTRSGEHSLFGVKEVKPAESAAGTPGAPQELASKPAAQLHITMAEELEKKGQDGDAIAYYEKARSLDITLSDRASRRLAVLYDRVDEQAKAMHEFQEQLKKRPKDVSLLNDLGYSYYNRGQWAEAETHLRKAISIDKQFKPAWVNLGLALAQQGKEAEALEAFAHAVTQAEAYANLGFVLAVQGKKAEAAAAYRKALSLEPALKIAQTALQKLESEPAPGIIAMP